MNTAEGAAQAGRDVVVRLDGLVKAYGGNQVFQGASLQLERGEFYALLGKNGSGKSTLIRVLAHREIPNQVNGLVLGVPFSEDFCETANRIGYVSEATQVATLLSIEELIELNANVFPSWSAPEMERLVNAFQLDLEKRVGELSRGQLVQLSLVLNLSYNPDLILLDEVTAVLDARVRNFLMHDLARRVRDGATVVLATNIVTEVHNFATSLILLGEKKVKLNSRVSELRSEFVKLRRDAAADHPIFAQEACMEVGLSPSGVPFYLVSKADALAAGVPNALVSNEVITPAEIFVFLTRLRN